MENIKKTVGKTTQVTSPENNEETKKKSAFVIRAETIRKSIEHGIFDEALIKEMTPCYGYMWQVYAFRDALTEVFNKKEVN